MIELDKAQGGQLYQKLGEIGAIAPSDARRIMDGFCPSIAARLKKRSQDRDAYEGLLALLDDNEADLLQDGDLTDEGVLEDGRAVLAEIYGSEEQARHDAVETARALGIEPQAAAEKLHPIAAALVLSILSRRYREPEGDQEDSKPSETASAREGEGRPSIIAIVLAAIGGAIMRALVRQLLPRRRQRTRTRLGRPVSRRRRPRRRAPSIEDLFRDLIR
jgi:hypothetical protein